MVIFLFRSSSDVILVSVHVRRTDYLQWLADNVSGHMVSIHFFMAAMHMFRQKYNSNAGGALSGEGIYSYNKSVTHSPSHGNSSQKMTTTANNKTSSKNTEVFLFLKLYLIF
jgi:hypothetical protein